MDRRTVAGHDAELDLEVGQGMDDAAVRRALVGQFTNERDLDKTHEIYHDDAVLEFPQSGERFVGKANFLTWRKRYPADVEYRIRRISGGGELWVIELLVSYNGGPPMFGVSVVQFRGDKIAKESIYATEGFEAATWRSAWATRFDPLASVSPSEWDEDTEFGLDLAASPSR
jgi:SnoaL-like domain